MESEYLLIISPDDNTYDKLMEEKKRFAQLFDCSHILSSKPHITMVRFSNKKENEPLIMNYLKRKISAFAPFSIQLDGFGAFPTHTIFAKVATRSIFTNIIKSLKSETKKLQGHSAESVHFITEPHMTIARSLQHWQYEKGWLEWRHVPFSARFLVSELLLLKKEDNRLRFQLASSFSLLGIENEMQQGSLF